MNEAEQNVLTRKDKEFIAGQQNPADTLPVPWNELLLVVAGDLRKKHQF